MKPHARIACLLAAGALVSLAPRADACQPPPSEFTGSIPKSGETYPANAAIFFLGVDLLPDGVSVTVDGQAATLKPVTTGALAQAASLVATIEPPPSPGQNVVISGDFCAEPSCKSVTVQFTAGPEDTVTPQPSEIKAFDVYDHADYVSQNSCDNDIEVSWFFDLLAPGFDPSESPRIYSLERSTDASFTNGIVLHTGFAYSDGFPHIERGFTGTLAGNDPAEAFCFRLSTVDAAGHSAGSSPVVCKPRYCRAESGPSPMSLPSEPIWTSADTYAGGSCNTNTGGSSGVGGNAGTGGNSGTGGSSSGGSDDGGCSVRAAGGSDTAPGALAGMLLALGAFARVAPKRRIRRSTSMS